MEILRAAAGAKSNDSAVQEYRLPFCRVASLNRQSPLQSGPVSAQGLQDPRFTLVTQNSRLLPH